MTIFANLLVALVACLHLYFLILEMFLWTKPRGRKTFGNTVEFAEASKVLAANQGLYNGFLSAGLFWGIFSGSLEFKIFFLGCVIVAGIYGAFSVSRKIFFIQALPGLAALALVLLT
jgi:putative membrane protein